MDGGFGKEFFRVMINSSLSDKIGNMKILYIFFLVEFPPTSRASLGDEFESSWALFISHDSIISYCECHDLWRCRQEWGLKSFWFLQYSRVVTRHRIFMILWRSDAIFLLFVVIVRVEWKMWKSLKSLFQPSSHRWIAAVASWLLLFIHVHNIERI